MIEISKLTTSDRNDWERLFRGYLEFYGRSLAEARLARTWDAFMDDSTMHALGARLDGRLYSIAHFLTHASTTSADVCYLQDLFTAGEARGNGLAGALIAEVAAWATSRGCGRLYWSTHESNVTARRLYDRVGHHRGFVRYEIDL